MQVTQDTVIGDLSLSTHARVSLCYYFKDTQYKQVGIPVLARKITVGDVLTYIEDLRKVRSCGVKTANEIIQFFATNGYVEKAQHWASYYQKLAK